jgi:hypothetical protein
MKYKMVTGFLVLCMVVSLFATSGFALTLMPGELAENNVISQPAQLPFNDIKGHWAESAIMEVYAKEVIRGYDNFAFRPNQPVTSLEGIVMIDRLLGYETSKYSVFADGYLKEKFNIPEWAVGYVGAAFRNDILLYSELEKIALRRPMTRLDAATMAIRALGLAKQIKRNENLAVTYKDLSQLDLEDKAVISLVSERKIMNGFTDGSFQPENPISRAEMASILSNLFRHIPGLKYGEVSGVVKSVNPEDNIITILVNDSMEEQVVLPQQYYIYFNDKAVAIDKLVPGYFVRIIGTKAVGIKVLIVQLVVSDEGNELSIEEVNLKSEPLEIQQWVEINRNFENYLARVYNGKLYFLVTRGEKMTGGYTVNLRKVSYTIDDKEINYKVWMERSDPDREALVNQVISYPYALVRVDLSKEKGEVSNLIFVDELNEVLAKTKLEN